MDYFTELMFYYGILFGITFYEIDRQIKGANFLQSRLDKVNDDQATFEEELNIAVTNAKSVGNMQVSNRKEIFELDEKVSLL